MSVKSLLKPLSVLKGGGVGRAFKGGAESKVVNTSQSGLSQTEVQSVLAQGNLLSIGQIKAPVAELQQQVRRTQTTFTDTTKTVKTFGFQEEFSSLSQDQLTAIVDLFQRRAESIQQRLATPGRQQVTTVRRK